MKKVEQIMQQQIDTFSGSVLAFCINNSLQEKINNNENILTCNFLDQGGSGSIKKGKRMKKIGINQMRKKFHKKKTDFVIYNIDQMYPYTKIWIKDSIYLSKNDVYLYTENMDTDIEFYEKRYKRYHTPMEKIECKDGWVLRIKVGSIRSNRFKDRYYRIVDTLIEIGDMIGDILAS